MKTNICSGSFGTHHSTFQNIVHKYAFANALDKVDKSCHFGSIFLPPLSGACFHAGQVWQIRFADDHAALRVIFMRAYQSQAKAPTWLAATP